MSTILQKRLIDLISANLRSSKKITLGELMLQAGYSKSQARHPQRILDSPVIKKELNPLPGVNIAF